MPRVSVAAKSHLIALDCGPPIYGSNSSGKRSNVYGCGRLRHMKPPICQPNRAAKPTRNSAPANSPVATARASSQVIAIATSASNAMPPA